MIISAQAYEDIGWDYLAKKDRKSAVRAMRQGANIALGKGRSNRMKDYADAIEETEGTNLYTQELIQKWLDQEIDPEEKEDM